MVPAEPAVSTVACISDVTAAVAALCIVLYMYDSKVRLCLI